MHITTRKLTAAAVTGAAYAALTMLLAPISYGAIQCRVSEVLCILPFFIPCTAWGLFAGCAIANLLSAAGIFDVVFGSLATLLAAICTYKLRDKFWLSALMPVLFNGVIVGAVVHFCYAPAIALPLCMLSVAAGEAVACLIVGPILISVLRRMPASVLN